MTQVLGGRGVSFKNSPRPGRFIIRVADREDRPTALRASEAFIVKGKSVPKGFALYLVPRLAEESLASLPAGAAAAVIPDDYAYLSSGDIVRLTPEAGTIRVLYRKRSAYNAVLLTEQCDNYCL